MTTHEIVGHPNRDTQKTTTRTSKGVETKEILEPSEKVNPHPPSNGNGATSPLMPRNYPPHSQPLEEGGATGVVTAQPLLQPLLLSITRSHRQREDFHRAEKSLTLNIKAICRRRCDGDLGEAGKLYKSVVAGEASVGILMNLDPFIDARETLESSRKMREKEIIKMVRQLPIWYNWAKDIRGIGELSLGQIIGEVGDISNYATVSKLWKRMGVAVIDGGRQRNIGGNPELNILHGYSGKRRSILFILGDNLIRAKNVEYRVIYDYHKAKWEELYPDGSMKENNGKEYKMTKGWRNSHAKRVMSKSFLKDLWRAWRDHRALENQDDPDSPTAT